MLAGKAALVVGGSRGIGGAVSRALAADGAAVALIYRSRAAEAEALVAELGEGGATARAFAADATDADALRRAIDAAGAWLGRLDILVFVAGVAVTGPLESYSDDDFDRTFALNVRAPFVAIRHAARLMGAGGRIVTVGSIVADRMPGAGGTLYAASKAALGGLTRGLARDLAEREITANLVQPGPIDTERNPADGPHAEANREPLALKRHGTAAEVASLVAFLVSPAAAFITGATYNIDGGWSA